MGEVLLARDSLEEVVDSVSEKILLDIPPGGFKTLKNKELKLEVGHNRQILTLKIVSLLQQQFLSQFMLERRLVAAEYERAVLCTRVRTF